MNRIGSIVSLLSLTTLCGCAGSVEADYAQLGLVDVSGTIHLDGQPLAGAVVYFEAPDGTFCYGRTDEEGEYTLNLNSEQTGVMPGEKVVRIRTAASTGEHEGATDEEDPDMTRAQSAAEERVPECYNRQSKLTVTVTDSDSAFDFDLRSDCSTTKRN